MLRLQNHTRLSHKSYHKKTAVLPVQPNKLHGLLESDPGAFMDSSLLYSILSELKTSSKLWCSWPRTGLESAPLLSLHCTEPPVSLHWATGLLVLGHQPHYPGPRPAGPTSRTNRYQWTVGNKETHFSGGTGHTLGQGTPCPNILDTN